MEAVSLNEYDINQEQDRVKAAQAHGMTVVVGSPVTLTLDLDTSEAGATLAKMREMVNDKFGIQEETSWPSKSGGYKKHVVITLKKPLPLMTRIALQAILGSDPKRECLNIHKHMVLGIAEPCLLFKPVPKAKPEFRAPGSDDDLMFPY